MIAVERVSIESVLIAHSITDNAADFNAAIWAAIRLREITMSETTNSAFRWSAITPSDTATIAPFPAAVYVGGAGTVRAVGDDGVTADFVAPAGALLLIQPQKIMATGTTATALVGLRND